MKRKLITLLVLLSFGIAGQAQNVTNSAIENYINQYKGLAMSEQIRTGVPAAITLAQGIFETGGGTSELCLNAHNHFGVKCKGKWQGGTYSYDDDEKDECFRKYQNDRQSYMDHSNFLKNNPRYSRLFKINPKHYRKWAEGLRECGYATNKKYAHKLIDYIEQYNLDQYTIQALDDAQFVADHGNDEDSRQNTALLTADNGLSGMSQVAESTAASTNEEEVTTMVAGNKSENKVAAQQAASPYQPMDWDTVQFYVATKKNGLKGFYAPKGDLLLEYAIKHYIRYGKLLSMNNLPDEPLSANMFIYLEKKRKRGLDKNFQVPPGMDLIQVSQETAVDLEQLRLLNHLQSGENPAPGTILQLQEMSTAKPALALAGQTVQATVPLRKAPVNPSAATNSDDDYVVLRTKEQPTEKVVAQETTSAVDDEEEQPTTQKAVAESSEVESNATASVPQKENANQQESNTDEPVGEKQMTNLEKLRARMNGIVYGDKQVEEAPAQKIEKAETVIENQPNSSKKKKTTVKDSDAEEEGTPTEKLRAYMKSVKEDQPEAEPEHYTTLPAGQAQTPASTAKVATEKKHSVDYYTVKRGDTAYSIAKKFNISLTELKNWNGLPKSMVVQVGDKLKVAP